MAAGQARTRRSWRQRALALKIPLGVAIAIRLLPAQVWEECRRRAQDDGDRPAMRAGALLFVGIWLAILLLLLRVAARFL